MGGATEDDLNNDDRSLVERAQRGDVRAFRQLYERHAAAVHRFAILPLVRDANEAEDVLADTFVRALEHIERFSWQGKGILPWLIRIAKNLALDRLRRANRFARWPEEFEDYFPDADSLDGERLVSEGELTQLLRARIAACLEAIHPRYRRVLHLRLVEGVARDRAAAVMEVTVGTLDVLLFRASKAFRKVYLARYGVAFDPDVIP